MPDPADRAVVDSWSETARMPFAVESLPSVRHQLLADVSEHHVADEAAYDAALVLAELVSNALKYAKPLGDGSLHLQWGYWDDSLHVQVTDGGATTEPDVKEPEPTATSGRGLAIVDAISAAWGVERGPARTTVWVMLRARGALRAAGRQRPGSARKHLPAPAVPSTEGAGLAGAVPHAGLTEGDEGPNESLAERTAPDALGDRSQSARCSSASGQRSHGAPLPVPHASSLRPTTTAAGWMAG